MSLSSPFELARLTLFACAGRFLGSWNRHIRALAASAVMLALSAAVQQQLSAQTVDTVVATNLFEPYGIAVDANNLYYITDSANNRVMVFNPDTGVMKVLAGTLDAGAEDGMRGIDARFYNPQGITVVSTGLVVADTGNHLIRHITFDGQVTTLAGDINGARLSHENGLPPDNFGFRNGKGGAAQFNAPMGVAGDGHGNVFIADSLNNAIRKLDLNTREVTTVASGLAGPEGVAVSAAGDIYVANRDAHSILVFREGETPRLLAGKGSSFDSGYKDSANALDALFKNPRGLLFNESKGELLVADSGNSVVRRVYNLSSAPSVDTFGNTATAGLVTPIGLAKDASGVILIADLGADKIRAIHTTQTVQPAIEAPRIGTVVAATFCGTTLQAATNSTFNNDVILAILPERDTQTFYTYGATTNFESIPDPRPTNDSPPLYTDCQDNFPPNLLDRINPRISKLTLKAYSTQNDRRPSPVTVATFVFQVANPTIIGNPASFKLSTITSNAVIYYISGPTEDIPDPGPGVSGAHRYNSPNETLNIFNGSTVFFKARAIRDGYEPSAVIKREFTSADVQFNKLEIPRDFEAGIGASIIVPIEVTLSTSNVLRSLQFRFEVDSAQAGGPAPALSVLPLATNDFFPIIGPLSAPTTIINYSTNTGNGLGIVYSANPSFQVTDAGTITLLRVDMPKTAHDGDVFRLRLVNPSATSDGQQSSLPILSLEDHQVTVRQNLGYVVGDTAGNWYNAGEFGDGKLQNNDFNDALFVALGLKRLFGFSDVFHAMDAFPLDHDGLAGGDGEIRFLDYQVILARSLGIDPNNWVRSRSAAGDLISTATNLPTAAFARQSVTSADSHIVWTHQGLVGAKSIGFAQPSLSVRVPVYASLKAGSALSGMHVVAQVLPAPGSPDAQGISFIPAGGLGTPSSGGAEGNVVYASWNLGSFEPALSGSNNIVGQIQFTVPPSASPGDSYTIKVQNADGAPDIQTQYDFDTVNGSVVVNGPAAATQVLPQEWLNRFLPDTDPALQAGNADPDGDGASNWVEYLNGTDPKRNDFVVSSQHASGQIHLSWFAHAGLSYQIETASNLAPGSWSASGAAIKGTGGSISISFPGTQQQFFRVRLATQ
jgi:sugar lactone lactonase YvrE